MPALTLLTIAQSAIREIGSINVPSTIVANTDPLAVQILALAQRSLKTIALDYKWQVLLATHTFSTANGTATYALPADYHRFANLTFWDRTNYEMIEGPVSPAKFEYLRSSSTASVGMWKYFRIAADLFAIYPTPSAVETIAYQYYSKYPITGKAAYSADSDTPLIDEDLLTIDLRWRFLQAKGLDFEHEKQEYMGRLAALIIRDGGKDAIRFGGPRSASPYGNLPDMNFGS